MVITMDEYHPMCLHTALDALPMLLMLVCSSKMYYVQVQNYIAKLSCALIDLTKFI